MRRTKRAAYFLPTQTIIEPKKNVQSDFFEEQAF